MRVVKYLKKQKDIINTLFRNNTESVYLYNISIFSTLIVVAVVVLLIPILASPWSESKQRLIPVYLLSITLLVIIYLLFRSKSLKKLPELGIYMIFAVVFALAIYLSVINSRNQRATIIIGLFCVLPMCIIDKPCRVSLFSSSFYIIHTLLSFKYKGRILGIDDGVNSLIFLILGSVAGNRLIKIRVEAFESKRQIILDRETDELTGLKNRRKLFQMIGEFESDNSNAPSCVIMMDIDNFKDYNDRYGHTAGDKLLNRFGELLLNYEEKYNVQFFRYGGEEFTGFAWGYKLAELERIAEKLKNSVNSMGGCPRVIGVSIGIVDCEIRKFKNYEKYIELADKALYRAKADGKNRVVCFDDTFDIPLEDKKV